MKRVWSRNDFQFITYIRRILFDLKLNNSDYWWLISDIDAYPNNQEFVSLLKEKSYVLLSTNELVDILEKDDFQWVWAVFSAIPSHYSKDDILSFDLPYIESFAETQYNPYEDPPKLQHPYAEHEILCSESGFALISDDDALIDAFRMCYPRYTDYLSIGYHSLKAYIAKYKEISNEIYIGNSLNCDKAKIKHSKITIVKYILGKYVVTKWLDYEHGQYSERNEFSDKDAAAEYAWKLFVNEMKTNSQTK